MPVQHIELKAREDFSISAIQCLAQIPHCMNSSSDCAQEAKAGRASANIIWNRALTCASAQHSQFELGRNSFFLSYWKVEQSLFHSCQKYICKTLTL